MEQTTIICLLFLIIINLITMALVIKANTKIKDCKNYIDEKDIEETMRKVLEDDKIEIL